MYVPDQEGEFEQIDYGLDQAGETIGFGCFLKFLSLNAVSDSMKRPSNHLNFFTTVISECLWESSIRLCTEIELF
jgi:hypothetical protein